jgi:serine/threonine protein kinase
VLFRRPIWKKISSEAKDLVSNMLEVDPYKRWSASECLKHPWITGEAHTDVHLQHMGESQVKNISHYTILFILSFRFFISKDWKRRKQKQPLQLIRSRNLELNVVQKI